MKVLFLHNTKSKDLKAEELIDWLKARQEEVFSYTEKLDLKTVSSINPEIIVSYGYKYILKREILGFPGKGCINLHISYLPFNRGVDPNI